MLGVSSRDGAFQFSSLTTEWSRLRKKLCTHHGNSARVGGWLRRVWLLLFARQGFFGVESRYYEVRYAASELTEIVSQSIQACGSSAHLDPSRWLIGMYVACAVLNCWSTLIVQRVMANSYSQASRRLACVALDAIMDAGTAMAFPFVLLVPYAHVFDFALFTFPAELLYNDQWYTNFVNESRQVFPVSAFNLLVKTVPHVSIFMALKTIRAIVQPRARVTADTVQIDSLIPSPFKSYASTTNRRATFTDRIAMVHSATSQPRVPTLRNLQCETHRASFVDRCFIIWAFVLIACHISSIAVSRPADDQCKQPLQPWFVRSRACSLYMFNCFQRDVDSVYSGDLDFLDRDSLAVLVFAHCPALRVTPRIRSFPNLLGLEVYNSSLVEWGVDAAVSASAHPVLSYVFLIRTNMTGLPSGLLGRDLPASLMDIELSVTNLTSVPEDLDQAWAGLVALYIENSQLTDVPAPLLGMQLSELSLIGNRIASADHPTLPLGDNYMFTLARNPLATVPSSIRTMNATNGRLNLVDTSISVLPEWLPEFARRTTTRVFLNGSPFCKALSDTETKRAYGMDALISCAYTNKRMRGRYPLAVTAPLWLP